MVIAQLNGGLGNQLFQYAAAKALSLYHNVPLYLDASQYERDLLPDLEVPRSFELYNFSGIKEPIISSTELATIPELANKKSILQKLIPRHKQSIYTERYYHFDPNFFKAGNKVLLKGGWQSHRYFSAYQLQLQNILQLKESLVSAVKEKGKELKNIDSVAVHIRRSDYLRKKVIYEWHGVMDKEYYIEAIQHIRNQYPSLKVFYFTDDPDWVEQELLPLNEGELVSQKFSKTPYEDLYLMSQCRHNIIANSSFSWWGAWLNIHPNKMVIAPKRWFNKGPKDTQDLYPEGWIKL